MIGAQELKTGKGCQEDESCWKTEEVGASSISTYFPPVQGVRGGKASEEGKGGFGKSLGASATSHSDWVLSMRCVVGLLFGAYLFVRIVHTVSLCGSAHLLAAVTQIASDISNVDSNIVLGLLYAYDQVFQV